MKLPNLLTPSDLHPADATVNSPLDPTLPTAAPSPPLIHSCYAFN